MGTKQVAIGSTGVDALAGAGAEVAPDGPIGSAVTRTYAQLLDLVLSFQIKPGERVNESELSRQLGVSRTPLREALNRLVTEGILVTRPAKGFFCRQISAEEIFQLYQVRSVLELAGLKLAIDRVTDAEIDAFEAFMAESRRAADASASTQLALDEAFHERLLSLSGNDEMVNVLRGVNRKIRSVRWIDLTRSGRVATQDEHGEILAALRARDIDRCSQYLGDHIGRRFDQIDSAIREMYGRIYAGPPIHKSMA
jgi:DNA-binding GntR family transcriptional regulator